MPSTALGRLSALLAVVFAVSLGILMFFVAIGEKGGGGFFDNMLLGIPGLTAGATGVAACLAGAVSIAKRERSVAVILSTGLGFLVLVFVLGEVVSPH